MRNHFENGKHVKCTATSCKTCRLETSTIYTEHATNQPVIFQLPVCDAIHKMEGSPYEHYKAHSAEEQIAAIRETNRETDETQNDNIRAQIPLVEAQRWENNEHQQLKSIHEHSERHRPTK